MVTIFLFWRLLVMSTTSSNALGVICTIVGCEALGSSETIFWWFFLGIVSISEPSSSSVVRKPVKSSAYLTSVSYTHLRAHETRHDLVCRLLLEKKKKKKKE